MERNSGMRVIVTGATSFIGAAVVGRLLRRGDTVCAVVRPGSKHMNQLKRAVRSAAEPGFAAGEPWVREPEKAGFTEMDGGRFQVIELDLQEIEGIAGIICGGADAWVHIGWDGAGSDNRTRRDVQQANVVQSLAAVRAAAACGCRRFVFTGSQAEYGICHSLIHEDTPCHPVSEYGKAKADFANQAKTLCKILKIEYIHTRIFSVYGPGDHPWSLVQSCLRTWSRAGEMKLGPCTQQWNFLYIDDAADALCHLLAEGEPGIYNVAGQDTRPLRSYIEEMYELCGCQGSFAYGERPQNAEGAADLMPDTGKLRAAGWQERTAFADGIAKTLEEIRLMEE